MYVPTYFACDQPEQQHANRAINYTYITHSPTATAYLSPLLLPQCSAAHREPKVQVNEFYYHNSPSALNCDCIPGQYCDAKNRTHRCSGLSLGLLTATWFCQWWTICFPPIPACTVPYYSHILVLIATQVSVCVQVGIDSHVDRVMWMMMACDLILSAQGGPRRRSIDPRKSKRRSFIPKGTTSGG